MAEVLPVVPPESVGVDPQRLECVFDLIENWTTSGVMPGATLLVARKGKIVAHRAFGRTTVQPGGPPTRTDTIFLIASITKPVTYTALLRLVDHGLVCLSDPVARFIPEFKSGMREEVLVRHLLTHTSGLPDMLPNNIELRKQHADFKTFVAHICQATLLFRPGTNISYQSMGTALAAEIVERVTGKRLREVLAAEVFAPLGMMDTSLGWRDSFEGRVAEASVGEFSGSDWGWNSVYWRNFGAPWGGLFSTVENIARFVEMYRQGGQLGGVRVLSPALAAAAVSEQTDALPDIPPVVKLREGWGLGWRLYRRANPVYFGDLLTPGSFGHTGATGTFAWCDPARELTAVFFSNQRYELIQHEHAVCSNAIAAAVIA